MGKTLNTKRVVVFGGNLNEINPKIIETITNNDYIVCADKGYEFAVKNKIAPSLIVGDFDSSNCPENLDCEIIKLPRKKDDTDLHFAIKECIKRNFNSFVLTGVTGGRLDQTVASISSLNYIMENGAEGKIFDSSSELYVTNKSLTIQKPNYPCYLSVFPLGEVAKGVSLSGCQYKLENSVLTNSFPVGVSNEFENYFANISVKMGTVLVMVIKKA